MENDFDTNESDINDINDINDKVKEYGEISKTIKITQTKLKVLNKRKKQLQTEVAPKLKEYNVQKCNLAFGTLKVIERKHKIAPTKKTMKEKYEYFFNERALEDDFQNGTPEQQAEILYNFIYVDSIEYSNSCSISMNYNKEFKAQLNSITKS